MSERLVTVQIVKTEDSYNWKYLAELIAHKITLEVKEHDRQRKIRRTA